MSVENKDCLQRFLFDPLPIRGEYVNLHVSFQTIMAHHNYPPLLQSLLGEALAASVLLRAIIKFKGRLSIQFRGNGMLKLLLAQCNEHFQIRGLAKWEGEPTEENLQASFKQGVLSIIINTGDHNRYQGIVDWQGHTLAESLEGYFRHSEQLATKIMLSVSDQTSVGLLLQVIPGENKPSADLHEALALPAWQAVIKQGITQDDFAQYDVDALLRKTYPDDNIRLFEPNTVTFGCTCSRARSENALLLMGEAEARAELINNREIVVTCDFCNQQYGFDRHAVDAIFCEGSSEKVNGKTH